MEEVERLASIVEGLFAISRLDAGEAQAEWVRFDLAQLAASTADQMSLLAEDKQHRVDLRGCQGRVGQWRPRAPEASRGQPARQRHQIHARRAARSP